MVAARKDTADGNDCERAQRHGRKLMVDLWQEARPLVVFEAGEDSMA